MNQRVFLLPIFATILFTILFLQACGGGGGGGSSSSGPAITITNPTSEPTFSTTLSGVIIGGRISGAGFVNVTNTNTGQTARGFVNYNQGVGTWFVTGLGRLGLGANRIVATADADGTGSNTASDVITIFRPLVPLNEIFNGPNQLSATTFWTDLSSFGQSHQFAIFEDGTGRSTTGNALTENAGVVVDFTWTMLGPDSFIVNNCPTCSFQMISRIAGSVSIQEFTGQIETVGGAGEIATHAFELMLGNL